MEKAKLSKQKLDVFKQQTRLRPIPFVGFKMGVYLSCSVYRCWRGILLTLIGLNLPLQRILYFTSLTYERFLPKRGIGISGRFATGLKFILEKFSLEFQAFLG